MNPKEMMNINKKLFERMARFECGASAGTHTFVPCGKPATKVIEWQHQDGDREHRLLCTEHAVEQKRFWSEMAWDTGVEVSDIEDWQLTIRYAGRAVSRVGSRHQPLTA